MLPMPPFRHIARNRVLFACKDLLLRVSTCNFQQVDFFLWSEIINLFLSSSRIVSGLNVSPEELLYLRLWWLWALTSKNSVVNAYLSERFPRSIWSSFYVLIKQQNPITWPLRLVRNLKHVSLYSLFPQPRLGNRVSKGLQTTRESNCFSSFPGVITRPFGALSLFCSNGHLATRHGTFPDGNSQCVNLYKLTPATTRE